MKKFISPSTYFAQVKEELKSYFATGAIDDLMFPIWVEDAMEEFRKSQFPIYETLIEISNFVGELPCDFNSVKTVWACHNIISNPIWNPSSFYQQVDCRITPFDDKCHECFETENQQCTTLDTKYAVTIKSTGRTWFTYNLSHLLVPATAHTLSKCGDDCDNKTCDSPYTFDIRDNKISVNFREGKVHLIYYSNAVNEDGEQLVPDDIFTKKYLISYLKWKIFYSLYNTITDESINIIERKLFKAEQEMFENRIIAQTEMKKYTKYDMVNRARKTKMRFNNYRRTLR